jgi:hypothetical protein
MAAQREAIFSTLFNLLTGVADFAFISRTMQSWDDVTPSECPAMFLAKGDEQAITDKAGLPPIWKLTAKGVLYCRNDEGRLEAPSIQINNLLTLWEAALERQPSEPPPTGKPMFTNTPQGYWGTSLGGLCVSCQIVGQVQIFEGYISGAAMAVVPIEILTTA